MLKKEASRRSSSGNGGEGTASSDTAAASGSKELPVGPTHAWYSAITTSPSSLWVLLGLSIAAGIVVFTRFLRKHVPPDFGAFIKYFELHPPPQPAPPIAPHPLTRLTFAIKDVFDVEGFVTGFGSPDWEKTHEPASCTAPAVATLVQAGATCIGKTQMDEMGFRINGQNKHYETLINPVAKAHMPGGSSGGSAVAVSAELVDFALGTDTTGDVRLPAAYCEVLGFRPSHGAIPFIGAVPVSQSLDTIGWFAKDPKVLHKVGHVLLRSPLCEIKQPKRIFIADDCFSLLSVSERKHLLVAVNAIEKVYGKQAITHVKLGEYFASKIPSLKTTLAGVRVDGERGKCEGGFAALQSISDACQLLQGHEFKLNHKDWIHNLKGSGNMEHLKAALAINSDPVSDFSILRSETQSAVNELLMNDGLLVIPTTPGPPPKLRTRGAVRLELEKRALVLLSVTSMSGCCQVSIPMGRHNGCPSSISVIGKHGADHLLLHATDVLVPALQEVAENNASSDGEVDKAVRMPEAAEAAKEKGNEAFRKKEFKTAILNYSEAIQCDEANATYYNNRAAAYLAVKNFHLAETDCCKAIELDKKNVKAYMRRATARESLGCYKEADQDFRQALVLEPTNKTASDGVRRLKKLLE